MSTDSLGGFVLERKLGEGSSATVWRASHEHSGLSAAVKILRPVAGGEVRVRDEVRSMAALHHPHIVQVYDTGVDATHGPWIAMEIAGAGSLETVRTKLKWDEVRGVLLEVVDALAHAHARGVLHLDVKPSNVLLAGGDLRVKLADFGLALALQRGGKGRRGAFGGTPAFMAPEQFESRWRLFGPWTDMYGVGCLAWALITGEPPFGERDLVSCMSGHLLRPLPKLDLPQGFPPELQPWLQKTLAKAPADRFRAAGEARLALRGLGAEVRPRVIVGPMHTGPGVMPVRAVPELACAGVVDHVAGTAEALRDKREAGEVLLRGPLAVQAMRSSAHRLMEGRGVVVVDGVGAGLPAALGSLLRCGGLSGSELDAHMAEVGPLFGLRLATAQGAMALLSGGLTDPVARRAAVVSLVQDIALHVGLVVVLLDGTAEGRVASRAVREATSGAVLVLVLADDAHALDCPAPTREQLEGVCDGFLLGAGVLAADVEALGATTTEAVGQALTGWLDQGGLRLEGGRAVSVSGDVGLGWFDAQRCAAAVGELSAGAVRAMDVAAALGAVVELDLWRAACRGLDLVPEVDWLEHLVWRRFGSRSGQGLQDRFRWHREALRKAVLASCHQRGLHVATHRACAAALTDSPGAWTLWRRATHEWEAGEFGAALDHGAHACRRLIVEGRFAKADDVIGVIGLWTEAMGGAWPARALSLRARIAVARDRLEDAASLARSANESAAAAQSETDVAEAEYLLGWSLRCAGNARAAWGPLRQASAAAERLERHRLRADCTIELGFALLDLGKLRGARVVFEQAADHCAAAGHAAGGASVLRGLCLAAWGRGRLALAERYARDAVAAYEQVHSLWGQAVVTNDLGNLLVQSGDLAGGLRCVREARRLWRSSGPSHSQIYDANLARLLLRAGGLSEAEQVLEAALRGPETEMLAPLIVMLQWVDRRKGRGDRAAQAVERLRVLEPEPHPELARWLLLDVEDPAALALGERLLEQCPASPERTELLEALGRVAPLQ